MSMPHRHAMSRIDLTVATVAIATAREVQMIVRRTMCAAVLMLGVITVAAMPAASADPTPGTECSVPGNNSPDGTLTCDGMRSIWLHVGAPIMQPGQPCSRLGDVTATSHEGTVTCRQSSSALTWQ
jgi:hypothetical protein